MRCCGLLIYFSGKLRYFHVTCVCNIVWLALWTVTFNLDGAVVYDVLTLFLLIDYYCKRPSHLPWTQECPHFVNEQSRVLAFGGHKNVLSNFYPYSVKVFGETHKSAEHVFQLTKALRSGDQVAAEKVCESKTALEAKRAVWCCSKITAMYGHTTYRHGGNPWC